MTPSVDISFKWSDFSKNVSESWMCRAENSEFSDITLVSEDGQKMKAHKIILANSSLVFRSVLMDNNYTVPLIYFRGVQINELGSVLEFIYNGETKIKHDNLKQFLDLAEELKLKGINEEGGVEADRDILNEESHIEDDFETAINSQMKQFLDLTDELNEAQRNK